MTTTAEFTTLTAPFRPELLVHCYRMLGSIHDAEDLVQETYLRAWRGFDRFEGRSSLRRWMYAIATRTCLTALERSGRRPLPSGLGPPAEDHRVAVAGREPSVRWLEPAPDPSLAGADPESIMLSRAGIRLAFVAALQHLTARQRATLVLRDVLAFSTRETADILETTAHSVDAALRRARTTIESVAPTRDDVPEPDSPVLRDLLQRYAFAFEQADADALVALLRADVELEMPPTPTWFTGRSAVVGFLSARVLTRRGLWHTRPTRANGQPAFAFYAETSDGRYDAYGIQVLTVIEDRVARITAFNDPRLLQRFGQPLTLTPQGRIEST